MADTTVVGVDREIPLIRKWGAYAVLAGVGAAIILLDLIMNELRGGFVGPLDRGILLGGVVILIANGGAFPLIKLRWWLASSFTLGVVLALYVWLFAFGPNAMPPWAPIPPEWALALTR